MAHSLNPLPSGIPEDEHDLASDPGVQVLASLVVPGELEEWGDSEESATEDGGIIRDMEALRREATAPYF